ncbi:probable UDP-N-acetylglucosamine pyrophosphorylase [Saccharomycodes ludwigii]|uniref:UDP-N-acetylglucosamine diphosphorylase n=1 Tax=Saccharomycodes ludwigii TaxID=36035 RepID=A0A376B9Z0_9ASCO|nr:hypothetical protein SCDLUD_002653 [Saccharomycodes ludwigii]KAH3901170.1 hypothetical protein SCDLUD_002653 [Saccharomycodes ludwigii]SSD61389.1 probable UDP-N-acetylglucosamine pyrophosphorylase [Saccharomycodes ludwigii]
MTFDLNTISNNKTVQEYIKAGQSDLFENFDFLTGSQKIELLNNLSKVDPSKIVSICSNTLELSRSSNTNQDIIEPLPPKSYKSIIGNKLLETKYYSIGLDAIKNGKVAVILMAGGQGSRLGSNEPKGCYDINLPSHKSLFQIQAEKLKTIEKLSETKVPIPWYIMTSKPTRKDTELFFFKNNFFGLKQSQVHFFNQGTLPALNLTGDKLLLDSPTSLVESPDGNGGIYRAIQENHLLDDLISKGIQHVHMYCVDNVLVKIADPVFIGFAIENNFKLATKAVRKRDAHESVGLIVSKNGKPSVIEYSEISKELNEAINPDDGLLKLRSANIVNHYYNVDLLKEKLDSWVERMPYHIAKKKIPYYEPKTQSYVKPKETPNGIKLEQFIFDVFDTVNMDQFGCLEVERSKEFSPLKNAPGSKNDNPETARLAFLKLGTSWLKDVGCEIKEDGNVLVEVSSLKSYSGENLNEYKGKTIIENGTIIE